MLLPINEHSVPDAIKGTSLFLPCHLVDSLLRWSGDLLDHISE
jgi:hypothetical protein